MVPCKSTAEEVSFEWSHYRISSTDIKVRTTLHVFIIGSVLLTHRLFPQGPVQISRPIQQVFQKKTTDNKAFLK